MENKKSFVSMKLVHHKFVTLLLVYDLFCMNCFSFYFLRSFFLTYFFYYRTKQTRGGCSWP